MGTTDQLVGAWLASGASRSFPASPARERRSLRLDVARGGRVSFQIVFRSGHDRAEVTAQVAAPVPVAVRVRRVGHVVVRHTTTDVDSEYLDGAGHIPGLVPDPLFDEATAEVGPRETNAFFVTLTVATETRPGRLPVQATVSTGAERIVLDIDLRVAGALQPRRTGFPVTHWLHADALCDWYGVEPHDDRFWSLLGAYLDNYAGHGSDLLYVPLFTPPLDGDRRPMQLLGVNRDRNGEFSFDWSRVRQWVELAQSRGVSHFEWTHLFSQWGAAYAPRIYEGFGADRPRPLWPAAQPACSDEYAAFLGQFLPQFHRFLSVEDLVGRSYFHLSDEPAGDEAMENYRCARAQIRDLAPWMRVIDALSDLRFAQEGLVDEPVALISQVANFVDHGVRTWAYFCCLPRGRYLNRLLDTPLPTVAMTGWLLHSTGVSGFLHWGYNYWYRSQTSELINPFEVTDGGAWPTWPAGDPCQVYPGPAGPIDSLRWEVFAESLQDLAFLRALDASREDSLLDGLIGFDDFPRTEDWLRSARRRLLRAAS